MSYGDRQSPSPAEQLARAGAQRSLWKLVAWIGGGTVALVVLFIVIFAAIAIYLGGGMPSLKSALTGHIGTAQSRPTLWLQDPAIAHSSLPNVVILAVMEHESHGQVFARSYNCTFGLTSPRRCSQTYLGGVIHTKSEDAGLMGINSGGWPKTPKWQTLGLGKDPWSPQKNIAAGVSALEADMAKYHYLKYALEAYNSGSGGPKSPDAGYAQAVLADIQTYEAGPTLGVWSPLPPTKPVQTLNVQVPAGANAYLLQNSASTAWIVAEPAGPYGAAYSVPWQPQPPKCATATSGPQKGTTACVPQPPLMLTGRLMVPPSTVKAIEIDACGPGTRFPCAVLPLSATPPDTPVWPGGQAWAGQTINANPSTVGGMWRVVATWPGHGSRTAIIDFEQPAPKIPG